MNRSQSATRMPQFLAAALAATVLLAAPAQAQRVSLDSLAGDHVDILDTQNRGASPIAACTTIDQPGSYAVVRNLSAVGDCLLVAADNVTIDLGGHVLTGDGTGNGVTTDGTSTLSRVNIAVRNGTVTGFDRGLDLIFAKASVVRQVRAIENTGAGIQAGAGSTIAGNTATDNGGRGIFLGGDSAVTGNIVRDNNYTGIRAGIGSTIAGNTVSGNGWHGIVADPGSTVTGNTARDSLSIGILAGARSTVSGNTSQGNGGGGMNVVCPSNVFNNTVPLGASGFSLILSGAGCNDVNNLMF